MNYEIWRLYESLPTHSRDAMLQAFADSPKTLRLIAFLDGTGQGLFKSLRAVKYIYEEELEGASYETLLNRYYKLRQGLKEWIIGQKQSQSKLTDDEQQLHFLRQMLTRNEFAYSLPRLLQLAEELDAKNIFEYLPDVYNLILRCRQALEPEMEEKQQSDEARFEEAIELNKQWMRATLMARRSFRRSTAEEQIQQLKRLAQRYKDYPRFALIYRYTAFTRTIFLPGQVQRAANAISRHYNSLRALQKAHPDIPVLYYEPFHQERIEFDILINYASFLHYRGQFALALEAICEREALRYRFPLISPRRSEGEYNNNFVIYLVNKEYDEGMALLEEFFEFQELQGRPQQRYMPYALLLHLHCLHSKLGAVEQEQQVLSKVDEILRQAEKEQNTWALTLLFQAKIDYLIGRGQLDKNTIQWASRIPVLIEHCAAVFSLNQKDIIPLFEAFSKQDKAKLGAILEAMPEQSSHADPVSFLHFDWLKEQLKRALEA